MPVKDDPPIADGGGRREGDGERGRQRRRDRERERETNTERGLMHSPLPCIAPTASHAALGPPRTPWLSLPLRARPSYCSGGRWTCLAGMAVEVEWKRRRGRKVGGEIEWGLPGRSAAGLHRASSTPLGDTCESVVPGSGPEKVIKRIAERQIASGPRTPCSPASKRLPGTMKRQPAVGRPRSGRHPWPPPPADRTQATRPSLSSSHTGGASAGWIYRQCGRATAAPAATTATASPANSSSGGNVRLATFTATAPSPRQCQPHDATGPPDGILDYIPWHRPSLPGGGGPD